MYDCASRCPAASCGGTDTYTYSTPSYGSNYLRALRQLQATADAIPVHRYTASKDTSGSCCKCCCCQNCCCNSCCCACGNACVSCSCGSCSCGGSNSGNGNTGCGSCGGSNGSTGCGSCGGSHSGCVRAEYYGYPTQVAAPNASLVFSRYLPAEDADASDVLTLPCGKYLVQYTANASVAGSQAASPVALTPVINGVEFPRGASFATAPAGGSTTLSASFMVSLTDRCNTLSFRNTGIQATTYDLVNISLTLVC